MICIFGQYFSCLSGLEGRGNGQDFKQKSGVLL